MAEPIKPPMTDLDKRLRIESDQQIADAARAKEALEYIISIVEKSEPYIAGYQYAITAIVWARKEQKRLRYLLRKAEGQS